HIQHDPAIMMTWNLKDRLPAKKLVYYGKVICGRPGFIALAMLPAFLRLRIAPGGYRRLYHNGQLSHCAKLIMDALARRGPAETRALKLSSGYAQARHRAEFDHAIKELQERFLALKVEERYDPFTYVWDTLEHRWKDAVRQSRALSASAAAYMIVRRYFETAAYGRGGALARLLRLDVNLVDRAIKRLEREGVLKCDQRIDGVRERVAVLARYAP
ncbi:MAG: AlkZ-related protein, partial [Candidatus Binataceae bacterium]